MRGIRPGICGSSICNCQHLYVSGGWQPAYNHNVSTTLFRGAQGATLGEPVSVGILGNPVNNGLLLFGRNSLVGVADSLEDVVDVLGDTENTRSRLRHCSSRCEKVAIQEKGCASLTIPSQINTHEASEAHQGVSHEGDTTTLGS